VQRGYGLVVNARIDVFLSRSSEQPQIGLLEEAITRARSYRAAGADCVFPILLHEADAITAFVGAAQAPVNILATPLAPPITQLAELGVARVSYGSSIHRHLMQELAAFLARIDRPPASP
ncbi:MAG TPA: isocitrate lyase/phosphoenolpyruvate mutase family protein, partial [Mycobacterium sp.]|nr:isocitrate lyase/phosphoenolpyruvate mutase family protein [Mycobacterium sp.]